MDKVTAILLEALRQGAAAGGEQRLYRSGKLPGLFAGRTTVHSELASQAVRDGLLEVVRTETKGKEESLTVKDFHVGLRRLHDRGALRLLPFEGPEGPPEPEYALLDGAAMYYFAAR